jgi:anti-anti-sigma factor
MKLKTAEENEKFIVVEIDGRMDAAGLAAADEVLSALVDGKNAVLDMCRVEYMASLGIRKLLQMAKAAKAADRKIVIANPQQTVKGVLELANIDSIIAVLPSVEEAKRFL